MRFLIDEDLPRSTTALLQQYGHEASYVRDIGLRGAEDSEIAAYAQTHKLCLLTGDLGFSDIRRYPPCQYFGLAVIEVKGNATAKLILSSIESFISQDKLLSELSGKLVIVEPGRIRMRR